jgi:hypothetical protein
MIEKHLLRPQRQRRIPPSFSWVDHRLVRQEYLPRADHRTWTLYLFLVTVADVQGLSYYSDASLGRHLHLDTVQLSAARRQLIDLDLIAHRKPLYQVLSWPEETPMQPATNPPRSGQVQSVAQVLRRVLEGGAP